MEAGLRVIEKMVPDWFWRTMRAQGPVRSENEITEVSGKLFLDTYGLGECRAGGPVVGRQPCACTRAGRPCCLPSCPGEQHSTPVCSPASGVQVSAKQISACSRLQGLFPS